MNGGEWESALRAGGNLSVDPSFTSATDLHLQDGSALIDAGVNPLPFAGQLADAFWLDIDGDPRPTGGSWDIGADEVAP